MAGIAVEMELHHSNPIQYFNHLKAFYYVALCESFTRAAEKLSLSQSTLSIQVQSLEQQLGFPLIKQNKRRIELTEEGNIIFSYAKSVFATLDDLASAADDIRKRKIKIGTTPTLAQYIVPKVIRKLRSGESGLKVHIFTGQSREVIDRIKNYEYHIGIITRCEYPRDLISLPVAKPKLRFVANDPGLAPAVEMEDLAGYPIILTDPGSVTRDYLLREFGKRGISIKICAESENAEIVKGMVNLGMGGAFFPAFAVDEDLREGRFREVALPADLCVHIDVVYMKDRKNLTVVRNFVETFKKHNFFR